MKHTKVLLLALFVLAFHAHAQVVRIDSLSPWKKSFKAGLNLNQAAFSSNWKGGGVNSFGFNSLINFKANYRKGSNSWDSEIDLLYGMVNNQGQGYRKTLDRIFLDTRYGKALNAKWDFTASMNVLTQFARGYKYTKDPSGVETAELISDFLAPAFITAALGVEYHPVDYFKVRISPLAPRLTVVRESSRFAAVDPVAPYGVPIGENIRYEWLAFQLLAEYNKEIAKNLIFKWRYLMFANYETIEPKTIDHRLDLGFTAKVNNLINVNLGTIIIYDYDQDKSVQLSQAFSLGILYTFQNYKDK